MRHLSLPRALGAAAMLLSASACINGTTEVSSTASDAAAVQGTVRSRTNGTGILGARVGVRIPANRSPEAYVAPVSTSDDNGGYLIGIYRTGKVTAPVPDTMTVWIVAAIPSPNGGTSALDSAQTQIQFAPISAQINPTLIDVLITPP